MRALCLLALLPLCAAPGAALATPPAAEDYVAPGYALAEGDRPYTGFGTRSDAPAAAAPDDAGASADGEPASLPATAATDDGAEEGAIPDELARLLDPAPAAKADARTQHLRPKAVREAAYTLGFQQGARHRARAINRALERRRHELSRIFNFRSLLYQGRVLPPVLVWAGPATALRSDEAAVTVEETYRITARARVVSAAPTWRDWLRTSWEAFTPAMELMPENDGEKAIWRKAVRAGWSDGAAQADTVFRLNLARLVADFRGMLRFTHLARLGLVRLPVTAEGTTALQVGADTLDVNETWFRITVPAAFQDPGRAGTGGAASGRPSPDPRQPAARAAR